MTLYCSSLSTKMCFIVWISIMPVLLLYNLHDLYRWLKLYYAPKDLLLFLWVLWLCKLIYHKLGWICCWMWNRNFEFGAHVDITALPEWHRMTLRTTAARNRQTVVLLVSCWWKTVRDLQSSVRRCVVLFC